MICVATAASPDLVSRCGLEQQRALADDAERRAGYVAAPVARSSRSHSRGLGGAAVSDKSCAAIGFDLEYVDIRRDWPSIASFMLGEEAHLVDIFRLSKTDVCKGWTFFEAYFKAFGERAEPRYIAAVLRERDVPFTTISSLEAVTPGKPSLWRQHRVYDTGFCATVVWESAEMQRPEWL